MENQRLENQKVREFLIRQWKEWRWLVFLILFVIIPVKSSLADWNWVPTGSMNPTIVEGDMVFVNKAAYDLRVPLTLSRVARWADPGVGDVVVCFSPEDGRRLVKRVVGVPGDEIEMIKHVLFINGQAMEYSDMSAAVGRDLPAHLRMAARFAREQLLGTPHVVMYLPGIDVSKPNIAKQVIPDGQYFLMGDSRDNSYDSRFFGLVERHQIIGKATSVIVSFDKSGTWKPRWRRFFSGLDRAAVTN